MMPVSDFAAELAGRDRCLVVHPGNPPYLLPIAEVVPAPFTRDDVVERASTLLEGAGMSVVHVRKEVTGFVFNRLQGAVLREAYCLVRDGVATVEDVDRTVRDGFGRRWALIGPFETSDLNTRGGLAGTPRAWAPPTSAWAPSAASTTVDARARRPRGAQRRELLALDQWEERVRWRDRGLIAIERARRSLERL